MYFAKIGRIERIEPIAKADNLVTAYVFSTPVVVSKDAKIGDIGLLFPEGGALAPSFLKRNNLYRDSQANADNTKTGYFEESGRVRAQPFRGAKSEGFFCPIEYLGPYSIQDYGTPYSFIEVGNEISEFDGQELCWKYVKGQIGSTKAVVKKQGRKFTLNVPGFEEHKDTKHWRFVKDSLAARIAADEELNITVTEKLHGTSGRYGYHTVSWSPIGLWFENKIDDRKKYKPIVRKILNKLLWWNVRSEYQYVVGSRRKILVNNRGFYGDEQYRNIVLDRIKHALEEGMTIYGEIVGYHPGGTPFMAPADLNSLKDKKILKDFKINPVPFSYGCYPGEFEFYVYRIVLKGQEFSHEDVKKHCTLFGLNVVPEYHLGHLKNGEKLEYLDAMVKEGGIKHPTFPDTLREGFVIRVDSSEGTYFYKEKTYAFKVCEGQQAENGPSIEETA